MRRRLSIAIALGSSRCVFLDEPTTGLDVISRRQVTSFSTQLLFMLLFLCAVVFGKNIFIKPQASQVWDVILRARGRGDRAFVLTTHSMQEAQVLCQRIGILHKGVLRCLGSAQHLKAKFVRGYRVTFLFSVLAPALQQAVSLLDSGFSIVVDMPGVLTVAIDWRAPASQLFIRLDAVKRELALDAFTVSHCSLDDVFVKVVS
jgi:ABC-type multidrug transport system ATPase subunit